MTQCSQRANAPFGILFMGTPDFAVPSLTALHEQATTQNWQLVAVATQPDRRAGRGGKVVASPVKQVALARDIPVLQPEKLRKNPAVIEELAALAPDLIVVAAYGLILPRAVLEIPTFGCVNVHASLLPAYRGASPIAAAILDGLTETGSSIMLMDEGMDTGPVLAQGHMRVLAHDTTATLSQRLAQQGAELLVQTLPRWLAGELAPIPQEELSGHASTVRMIKKEDGCINWHQPAVTIERMVRAYTPWPSAFTVWQRQPFKIVRASVLPGECTPGRVVEVSQGIAVGTGEGLLLLHEVQPAGKRVMDIRSFLNGAPNFIEARLGEE